LCIAAMLIPGKLGIFSLIAGWGLLAAYNLITVPTEMDASQRAKAVLSEIKPFRNLDEKIGVDRVMRIAGAAYIEGIFTGLSWIGSWLVPWWRRNTEPD
jgi:Zn-dependent membrane protease YugP